MFCAPTRDTLTPGQRSIFDLWFSRHLVNTTPLRISRVKARSSWLVSRRARDKIIVATKAIGRTKWTWLCKDSIPGCQSRAQLVEALEGSLKRLQTDYIDLYQLHWPDRPMRFFEGLNYLILREYYLRLEGDSIRSSRSSGCSASS
jgi:Aldo/keto reductase family